MTPCRRTNDLVRHSHELWCYTFNYWKMVAWFLNNRFFLNVSLPNVYRDAPCGTLECWVRSLTALAWLSSRYGSKSGIRDSTADAPTTTLVKRVKPKAHSTPDGKSVNILFNMCNFIRILYRPLLTTPTKLWNTDCLTPTVTLNSSELWWTWCWAQNMWISAK